MKKGFYYIIALLIVSLFWSCSTKKNTKASRFYHAFNSRYNICLLYTSDAADEL